MFDIIPIKIFIEKKEYIKAFNLLNNLDKNCPLERIDKINFICLQCTLFIKKNMLLKNKVLDILGIEDIDIIDMMTDKQLKKLLKLLYNNVNMFHHREREYVVRKEIIDKINDKKEFIRCCLFGESIYKFINKKDLRLFLITTGNANYSKEFIKEYFYNLIKKSIKSFKSTIQR